MYELIPPYRFDKVEDIQHSRWQSGCHFAQPPAVARREGVDVQIRQYTWIHIHNAELDRFVLNPYRHDTAVYRGGDH